MSDSKDIEDERQQPVPVDGGAGGPLQLRPEQQLEQTRSMGVVIRNAKLATDKEHNMTLLQGIKLYPKAVAWSVLISTCIAMEGYDVCLLSNFYSFPQFNMKFGDQLPDGSYQVPAQWQAGLSNGANVGEIIGLVINGFVSERFGYRYTVMACLASLIGFIAIFFTAQSVVAIQVGEILAGIREFEPLLPIGLKLTPLSLDSMGHLSDSDHHVCVRGVSRGSAWLPDHIRQLLLGHWTSDWHWRHQVDAGPHRPMGIPDSMGPAVDVAGAAAYWDSACSRVTMVAGPQGPG